MEKILFNTHAFDLVPMGIAINEAAKRRIFKFTTELPYQEIEDVLTDPANFDVIKYQIGEDETVATYADCVSLKTISKDIETGVYTAEYSTDEVARRMAEIIEALQGK